MASRIQKVFQMKALVILLAVFSLSCGTTNSIMVNNPDKGYTEICRHNYGIVDAAGNGSEYLMMRVMDYENDACHDIHIKVDGKEQARIEKVPLQVCTDTCDTME